MIYNMDSGYLSSRINTTPLSTVKHSGAEILYEYPTLIRRGKAVLRTQLLINAK